MNMRLRAIVVTSLAAFLRLSAACTLTDEGFEPAALAAPPEVPEPEAAESPLAESPSAEPATSEPACTASFELPSCVTAFAPPVGVCLGVACEADMPSCSDGMLNGSETGADCGGGCPSCPDGSRCTDGSDCRSEVCGGDGRCASPTCDDQIQNQDETAADCGGSCDANCTTGQGCETGADCASRVCGSADCPRGAERCCQAPTCDDGVRNGTEPVVDCGNAHCGRCPLDSLCSDNAQCSTGFCAAGSCRMHPCQDGALNDDESDVDCGGTDARCVRCSVGQRCNGDDDCSGVPCVSGFCFGCANGQRDANESDVDCGGVCGPCGPGATCTADADCQSDACQDRRCCGGSVTDCTRCARRLAQSTLRCELSFDPVAVDNCNRFLDCLAQHPAECPVRYAPLCSIDPGGVCDPVAFGGNGSPGVTLADGILGTAACNF